MQLPRGLRVPATLVGLLGATHGCGPSYPPGTVVLHVANWGGAKEGNDDDLRVERIYREFERENPGVRIQEDSVPGTGEYVPKMALAFIAHAQPDVLMLDLSSAAIFIDSQMVTDLRPWLETDKTFHRSDYFSNVFDSETRNGAIYAIPNDFTPMVVYFNKRLFDKAGVPYPTSDWNFTKFREVAQKLTTAGEHKGDPPKQYGFAFKDWPPGWVMWLWSSDADYLDTQSGRAEGVLDSSATVQTVSFLTGLVKDGFAPSTSETASAGVDLFANGQAAMALSGHWDLMTYNHAPKGPDGKPKITWDDVGVAAIPHEGGPSQTVMYESGYAISAQCNKKDLAWKFVKYMTSHDVQAQYQMSGIAVCARKDVANERAAASRLEASFLPIIPSCRPPYGSKIEGHEFVEDQLKKAMDSILQSGRDPYQALHHAALAIDREFEK